MSDEQREQTLLFKIKKFFHMDTGRVKISISANGVPSVTCEEYLRQPSVQETLKELAKVKTV